MFKDLVNKVAVVTNEANGKYLNLRPNFLPESSRPSSITSNPDNVSAAALQHVPHSISNSRNLESSFQHVQNVAPIHPHLIIANKPPHEILPHHSNPYAAPCPVRDQQYINYHAQMAPPSHFAPQSISKCLSKQNALSSSFKSLHNEITMFNLRCFFCFNFR